MGIPLHLLQQLECLSPLSLQSLVQLWFIILYLVLLQFFSICTYALNYAFVVEYIFVINMVGYEISDCLLSNSKHVTFKLGVNYGLNRDYTAHGLRKRNVCDVRGDQKCFQDPLRVRSISTAHMISQEKTCVINTSIAHNSFLLNVCDGHLTTHASKLIIFVINMVGYEISDCLLSNS